MVRWINKNKKLMAWLVKFQYYYSLIIIENFCGNEIYIGIKSWYIFLLINQQRINDKNFYI